MGTDAVSREARRVDEPVQRIYAHPKVSANAGKVAIQRGPVVYCLEEADNGANLSALAIARDAVFETAFEGDLLGGVVTVSCVGTRLLDSDPSGQPYTMSQPQGASVKLKAAPYSCWSNRQPGEMLVWLSER